MDTAFRAFSLNRPPCTSPQFRPLPLNRSLSANHTSKHFPYLSSHGLSRHSGAPSRVWETGETSAVSPRVWKIRSARAGVDESNGKPLKIGIVGFGKYGQFLAKTMVRQGHTVLAHSRSDHTEAAAKMGVSFFRDADDFCEEHPEVVLLCTSIISTEAALMALPAQRLRRSTLFADVLSVKEFPRRLFLQFLPPDFDVLCTHPMFGPESARAGWGGLPFVYDKVRIGEGARAERCERFLGVFEREGCRMVKMPCAEHDRCAAESQFITHTVGRILGALDLEVTPISTRGYEKLLEVVDNTAGDSFDLYYGLFMYNGNAIEQLERLDLAFDSLKKELLGRLHGVLRLQLFGGVGGNSEKENGNR